MRGAAAAWARARRAGAMAGEAGGLLRGQEVRLVVGARTIHGKVFCVDRENDALVIGTCGPRAAPAAAAAQARAPRRARQRERPAR